MGGFQKQFSCSIVSAVFMCAVLALTVFLDTWAGPRNELWRSVWLHKGMSSLPLDNDDDDGAYSSGNDEEEEELKPLSRSHSFHLQSDEIRKRYQLGSEHVMRVLDMAKRELGALAASGAEFPLFKPEMGNKTGIIYIKMHKVGGTAVAFALDNAAKEKNLAVLRHKRDCFQHPNTKFDMWFRHGSRQKWMEKCLPNGIFVTVIREPVSRYISGKTWMLNRDYFIHYPMRECLYEGPNPDKPPKKMPFECNDDAFRKRLSQAKLVKRAKRDGKLKPVCGEPCEWSNDEDLTDPEKTYDYVKENYGLVGVTKHLDAFLLLLALRFDFPLESMFYERCKDEFGAQPKLADLADQPEVVKDIRRFTQPQKEFYDRIEADFESYLGRLGPGFEELLKIYKKELQNFHNDIRKARGKSFKRWTTSKGKFYC